MMTSISTGVPKTPEPNGPGFRHAGGPMFAILAFIAFLLELLDVTLGKVEWIALGLMFVTLHLLVPVTPWRRG